MSKINTTIAANPAVQPCRSQVTLRAFHPAAAVFFIFDYENVRSSLTNSKSNTYEIRTHVSTRAVRAWKRETTPK
jgi:hypothetical protein